MSDKKTILVVEDEKFLSDIYRHQLEVNGCEVHVAEDGHDALKMLKRVKPDVILLDLIMPSMDGFDFLEALRALPKHKHRRVVVLSNLSQEADIERCSLLGVGDFFVKIKVSMKDMISVVLK